MPEITVNVGEDYTQQLKERLVKLKITHGELARQMQISPTQLSRWFNTDGMQPRLESVKRIEMAIFEICRERDREKLRAKRAATGRTTKRRKGD